MTNSITYGVPILLIVLLLGLAYVRIWSVPKKLRQINSQIKTIRKGKIPKPVDEARSRQSLIAGLFNDTFEKLEIVRIPEQMPAESIPVLVPELGELLIQLSILTHLDQQELDEFKADITKMKMSEQAAFVKEVIMQEAIRAARRDGKSVEEVLEDVSNEASRRLTSGEEVEELGTKEEEPEEERVLLVEEEEAEKPEPMIIPPSEEKAVPSEKLSTFELEELKAELLRKGVPNHEVHMIIEQARQLSRELVDELIKSLGLNDEKK